MAIYTLTDNIGLKKVLDGQKPWGNESRENLDKIDALISTILSTGSMDVSLNDNNIVLSTNPNQVSTVTDNTGDFPWNYLNFQLDDVAYWIVPASKVVDYIDGGELKISLRWQSLSTTGDTKFDVYFRSISSGDNISSLVFGTPQTITLSPSFGNYSETSITYSPTATEIKSDTMFAVKLVRNPIYNGDFNSDVRLLGLDIVHNLPKLDPQFVYNYFVGTGEDSASMDFTYGANGLVEQINETTMSDETRVTDFTYDDDGNVTLIVVETYTHTYIETHTYDLNGRLENVTLTFTENV